MASVIFFSIALCLIQNGDGLLPLGLIDPDEMIFLALLQEWNAFAHQGIEQNHAGLIARIRSSRIECRKHGRQIRSEEHTSELQSLMRISYAVFCLKKKKKP